ncbi:hypothetical protein CVM73_25820 [Bradyrhizobium forestalis]|uniref:Uncharacterized protein n=1 Tax=Bradyrhizobium forestalis TaxID=1419263 RepID=A0A2M8R3F5_9BRAD|nr:hypothetical protein [Bradyrhizobium forestalis]PJG52363.1 hypothetical protein CVM73_25820 [Bradyrhizobium forestalis]
MRKLILIATMSLLATQAYAGGSRSLSLAATDASQQATEPTAVTPQPPMVTQSSNVQTATTTPTAASTAVAPTTAAAPAATAPVATTPVQSTTAPVVKTSERAKPKHRQPSTEARVIRELHRHGIYW